MASLKETFKYSGGNLESIKKNFPELADIKLEFLFPTYKFIGENRQFLKNLTLSKSVSLNDTQYDQKIGLEIITSQEYESFLKHYIQNIPLDGPLTDLQTFIRKEELSVDLKINDFQNRNFSVLPFLCFTGDGTLIGGNEKLDLYTLANIVNIVRQTTHAGIKKYLGENLFLINITVLNQLMEIAHTIKDTRLWPLFLFLSFSIKTGRNKFPILSIPSYDELLLLINNQESQEPLIYEWEYRVFNELINEYFIPLFDFPIIIPEIQPVVIKGDIKFTGNDPVKYRDLSSYDLLVDYQYLEEEGAETKQKSIKYAWNDYSDTDIPKRTATFDFQKYNDFVLDANKANKLTVSLKLFDGTVLWHRQFEPDDPHLSEIHIEVPLTKANVLGGANSNDITNANLFIKGKVIEVSGKCSLKDLTVIIQAKAKLDNPVWRVVGVATTDITGSFKLAYPLGIYEAAQALVSLSPNKPISIKVYTDDIHKQAQQTLSHDFLYLLLEDVDCDKSDDQKSDCDCHSASGKTPRLPDQEDLIGSDKYSQDLGGGTCVNLTTPNRTLSEQSYYAIVRTSDPDVANYVLQKTNVEQYDAQGNLDFIKVNFSLGDGKKIERGEINFENSIKWQDAPDTKDKDNHLSIYQAVSVAHGHLLHYKSVLKADGYSLGDLLHSLPLAPGQKKEIVVYDWKRSLQGSETQQLTQREGLNASIVNDRTLITSLSGSISESLRGSSTANTSGLSAGFGTAGQGSGNFGAYGFSGGHVLGISGGFANASSQASQDSARNTVQAFNETLRNAVMQSANAYRELNATVIDTITEGQQFSTTSEVVANHNHCHSLTMLYFEVLRHYAVYQELVQVEECVFVPLVMTNFTQENIHKWRDVLAANLLYRASNTYLPIIFNQNPLVKAFDANDRVLTNYANVDFPKGSYDDEKINFLKGQISLKVDLQRPKTRYDRIKSLPIVTQTTTSTNASGAAAGAVVGGANGAALGALVAGLLIPGIGPIIGAIAGGAGGAAVGAEIGSDKTTTVTLVKKQMFDAFMQMDANFQTVPPAQCIRVTNFKPIPFTFAGTTISVSGLDFFDGGPVDKELWTVYANILGYTKNGNDNDVLDMLDYYFKGKLIAEWDDIFYNDIVPIVFDKIVDSITIDNIATDTTSTIRYKGGEKLVWVNFDGETNLKRNEFPLNIKINSNNNTVKRLKDKATLSVENVKIIYSTSHYNGTLFSGYKGNDLLDGVNLYIPENSDEKRNPRKEDKFIVNELITHLNSNLEYYNKVLWYNLDPDRRYLLLDGFHIQVYDDLNQPAAHKSLASIVKNQLIGIAGNALIFPVAAGVKVDRSYIIVKPADDGEENSETRVSLFDHYRPLTPPPPYRISLPTRGIYAEAVQGACDACENVKDNSSQDWEKFKTDEPTPISTVTVPTPSVTDWKAAFKDFATPIVNIQNAPTAPAPGVGLAGLSELLGKSDIFKDITGLDANQKNALQTYLSNQENVKALAQMAKELAMQQHNTQNTEKIKGTINDAQNSGSINKDEANKLTKDHIQNMIDGGESKKAELVNDEKKAATEAIRRIPGESLESITTIDRSGDLTTVTAKPANLVSNVADVSQAIYWIDLIYPNVSPEVTKKVKARGLEVQKIETGHGDVNLDWRQVEITKLPNHPGTTTQFKEEELFDYIRKNFPDFLKPYPRTFKRKSLETYEQVDATSWSSTSPIGSVLLFTIDPNPAPDWVLMPISIPPELGLVLCTEYVSVPDKAHYWNFTTLKGPLPIGVHPVSGTRQFGLTRQDDSWIFFVRAADRATTIIEDLGSSLVFSGADDYWEYMMTRLIEFVKENGGEAERQPLKIDESRRYDWRLVQKKLSSKKPIDI